MPNKIHTTKKRRLHATRLFMCISALILFCLVTLYMLYTYNQPRLYGRWQSQETNKIVSFKKDGTVILEDINKKCEFTLLSPNKMTYIIDDRLFEMYYELDGRQLKWGMNKESLEVFKRK